ncbi:MAG: maltose alpha-D-glucosyltransferase [Actinomycetota bacterium]|nr:maltose alpha-D-glucosyltransferase [Actinomycetota bacterium]
MTFADERSMQMARSVPLGGTAHWYHDAVFYELHVRAFSDSNADGVGDFRGLVQKLDYLEELGVTTLWLLPFYPSPLRDDGYDIADYRDVHPAYGTLRDFRSFLREAHRRGLRVVTELVLAHTSDVHPWFQRARRARPGSSYRDFYLWSDTPDRFKDARIIFKDFESSNWTFDPVAGAYFWHRFYSHQPSLNYDNPAVQQAMLDIVDYWLDMGVDGLRLDAVPYLYAREGTSCENLPETFGYLRRLRAHIDERHPDRMLLAEANQWPEDAVKYMGEGDMCNMAFHFPLMPRMFMAARQEDRFPIVDILAETPPAPPGCQWALFLRNHDELTLEMVTDEERDYMYRSFAQDPRARVNVGIRRRLAPLLGNDRALIEMMNGLLFSLPGTPIVYYGDEIGMGDNIYLGDRDAVRTPMQWNADRNAGFSRANPQQLYLPVVIDPVYHAAAVNVEAAEANPNSLLWWMRRMIHLRQRYKAFSRGTLEYLRPDNRKVLAFLRRYEDELLLVVVNLSRFVQCAELDLSEVCGAVPVELFGNMRFPAVGELPYFLTLAPHGFYWFSLELEPEPRRPPEARLRVRRRWDEVFSDPRQLEAVLARDIPARRWFVSKARTVTSVKVLDTLAVGDRSAAVAQLVIVRVELDQGAPEQYLLPLGHAAGERAQALRRWHPDAVIADLQVDGEDGVLYDALWDPELSRAVFEMIGRRRSVPTRAGRVWGAPAPAYRAIRRQVPEDVEPSPMSAEQSNSSVALADRAILKFLRRLEEGTNPGVELPRFLAERAHFEHAPRSGGTLEYRAGQRASRPVTLVTLEEMVPNEGDGWSYVVDALGRRLEEAIAHGAEEVAAPSAPDLLGLGADEEPPDELFDHVEWAALLGRRTGELHMSLASDPADPAFAPEPMTPIDRLSLYHGAGSLARRTFRQVREAGLATSGGVATVLRREREITERFRAVATTPVAALRIRVHGDYHLGQVLWTGKDIVIIDFEGEPTRSLGQRRLKRPAAKDLAGMVRSFHYASRTVARLTERDLVGPQAHREVGPWLFGWYRWMSAAFLRSYLAVPGVDRLLPDDPSELAVLLDFFLLEKAVAELAYEANARPGWVDIPASGILDVLDGAS